MRKKKRAQIQRQEIPVLNADPETGLGPEEVRLRTSGGWTNGAAVSAGKTEREIVLKNTLTFFNLVFAVLAAILIVAGSSVKNMMFLGVLFSNAAIGIYQELRAKRAVDKLTLVAAQQLRTVRSGQILRLRSEELVRDDIVEFTTGDQICADGILRSGELRVNEALITGEADPIRKEIGDELRSGSFVVAGTGRVQLTNVGSDAFAAKLAAEAKADPQAAKSEMMRSLDKLIRFISFALIPIGLILFYQAFQVRGESFRESSEGMVGALVGMIPDGLYLLTSVAMAASAIKLAGKRVLVQDMNCIETLARVDVLCVDKTGTITEPIMEVEDVIPLTEDPPERLEKILTAIYSGTEPENDTAQAMAEMFAGETDWVCLKRIPFTSETKWSAADFRGQGTFVVGAPEFTLQHRYEEIRELVEEWSARGCRVLLICQHAGELDKVLEPGKLRPLALILLMSRIRQSAPETFAYFEQQGVAIKVISGDNPVTVSEVARRAGITGAEKYIDASILETDQDFLQAVDTCTVFGRVTPDKKKKLIRAFKKRKHTVAMTGDGVNDVLALKEADCGVAMASGAQAASQVGQLVLLDSDFSAMPHIVDEGRRVINNIQRAATLFLVKNIFSLGMALITSCTNWPYPMIPFHLTIISVLTIGVPSFFLAMEPNYERFSGHFLRGVLRKALPGGLTNIFVVLMALAFMMIFDLPEKEVSAVCTAILATVGLLVLFQTCKPFDKFRALVWGAMTVAMLGCFTLLGGFFELQTGSPRVRLVMFVLLVMTPTVFFAVQRILDWGDRAVARLRRKPKKKRKP